eukprot:TRINITY_DN212_c0_g1_i1.p1 TRINITY_DN212_c0_g1~~TRINITY_DN212_c0_g1_i1.p1  ORF type:complete len:1296 (-),score=342.41 TRINITY_DN212_c0_g1_i1:37-3924(-)
MLCKEITKNGVLAWCNSIPDLLAVGSFAGSINADFSSGGSLEIRRNDTLLNRNMPVVGAVTIEDSFNKIAWSHPFGDFSAGLIAGGAPDGSIHFYNPSFLTSNTQEGSIPKIATGTEHGSSVYALDWNPITKNLLASGALNSEVLIWDFRDGVPTPMTPGERKGVPSSERILSVQWNKKFPQILAVLAERSPPVIWDLRAKQIRVTLNTQRTSAIAWSPDHPTTIATASDDDNNPVVQIWDLTNAHTPQMQLTGHKKGVTSLSWSSIDHSLLLSSSRDGSILCYDVTKSSENIRRPLCEVDHSASSSIDVQWSPKAPYTLSSVTLDGKIKTFSLEDTAPKASQVEELGADAETVYAHAPKWMKRSCGADFAFGGKLISFGNKQQVDRGFTVRDVVTNEALIERAANLEQAITARGNSEEFCNAKIRGANTEEERTEWEFIKARLIDERKGYLSLLDYDVSKTNGEIGRYLSQLVVEDTEEKKPETKEEEVPEPKNTEPEEPEAQSTPKEEGGNSVSLDDLDSNPAPAAKVEEEDVFGKVDDGFDVFGSKQQTSDDMFGGGSTWSDDPFQSIGQQTTTAPQETNNNNSNNTAHSSGSSSGLDSFTSSSSNQEPISFLRPEGESSSEQENIITKSLIVGNFKAAIDCCIKLRRWSEALILASCAPDPQLLKETQALCLQEEQKTKPYLRMIYYLSDLKSFVDRADLSQWKAVLAILSTYATNDFEAHANILASRLEYAGQIRPALLCFIAASNINKAVGIWLKLSENTSGKARDEELVNLIEKIAILRNAGSSQPTASEQLLEKYIEFAEALANQGRLDTALATFTNLIQDGDLQNIRNSAAQRGSLLLDRLKNATQQEEGSSGFGQSTGSSVYDDFGLGGGDSTSHFPDPIGTVPSRDSNSEGLDLGNSSLYDPQQSTPQTQQVPSQTQPAVESHVGFNIPSLTPSSQFNPLAPPSSYGPQNPTGSSVSPLAPPSSYGNQPSSGSLNTPLAPPSSYGTQNPTPSFLGLAPPSSYGNQPSSGSLNTPLSPPSPYSAQTSALSPPSSYNPLAPPSAGNTLAPPAFIRQTPSNPLTPPTTGLAYLNPTTSQNPVSPNPITSPSSTQNLTPTLTPPSYLAPPSHVSLTPPTSYNQQYQTLTLPTNQNNFGTEPAGGPRVLDPSARPLDPNSSVPAPSSPTAAAPAPVSDAPSEKGLEIVQVLKDVTQDLKGRMTQAQKTTLDGVVQRLDKFYPRVLARELPDEVEEVVLRLVLAVRDGDSATAQALHKKLSDNRVWYEKISLNAMLGLQRLIPLSKSGRS